MSKKKVLNVDLEGDVSKMTIADVLKTQTFFDTVASELKTIWENREKIRVKIEAKRMKLKAHPIDLLEKDGYLKPGNFIVAYAKIVDKKITDLSRSKRDFIQEIGSIAFHKAMRILINLENETTGKDSNGND